MELPYDVPATWNKPALRVSGDNFFGQAMGVYSFFAPKFSSGGGPEVTSAIVFEGNASNTAVVPSAFSLFLTGHGSINGVIDGHGPRSSSSNRDTPQWCSLNAQKIPNSCASCF